MAQLSDDMRELGVDALLVARAVELEAKLAQMTLLLRAGLLIAECLDDSGDGRSCDGTQRRV